MRSTGYLNFFQFYSKPTSAYVYLLTNSHKNVLYVGMTTDLRTRIHEHQMKQNPVSFTARYNVSIPVYYEGLPSKEEAIERERFIKGKTRRWKRELISNMNPSWNDLSEEIFNMKA